MAAPVTFRSVKRRESFPVALVDGLLDRLDRSRFTPQGWAQARIEALHDERRRRAMLHPRWQEIQALRGPGGLTLLSDEVGWADWEEQSKIEHDLLPDPWWLPVLRRISQMSLLGARARAGHAGQRVSRGWSDRDVWSLDTHLCRTLAGQLRQLADEGLAWPGDTSRWVDEYAWQAELRRNADLLWRYADGDVSSSHWYELASSRDSDPQKVADAWTEIVARDQERLDGAKTALRWVADHLEHLWD